MEKLNEFLERKELFSRAFIYKNKLSILQICLIFFCLWIGGLYLGKLVAIIFYTVISKITVLDEATVYWIKKVITCGTQIVVFALWVHFFENRQFKMLGLWATNRAKHYIIGFLLGFISITFITFILVFTNMVKIQKVNYSFSFIVVFWVITGWIVQSASEEIAFRGWLVPVLGKRYSPVVAVAFTAFVFGIIHLFSAGVTILSFVNIVLSGVFFTEYAVYSNNIWGVCGLHFAWNLSLGNIYGFPVSGFSTNNQAVLCIKEVGDAIFTGGRFGPEGGIFTTFVLVFGIMILTIMIYSKYKSEEIRKKLI